MLKIALSIFWGVLLSWGGSDVAFAATRQVIDNSGLKCIFETLKQERRDNIPTRLLSAISLAESGRWDKTNRESVAWPWTVTSGGEGRFFDSKQEAIAEVEILMTEGVRNIDVGCMQINMYYHADAFETLDAAFDPATNIAYAAKFLKQKYIQAGSWPKAVALYHSSIPNKGGAYAQKVLRLWNEQRELDIASLRQNSVPAVGKITLDRNRTARLNSAFRKRLERERNATNNNDKDLKTRTAARHKSELDAWRNDQFAGQRLALIGARRLAEVKRKKRMQLVKFRNDNQTFEQRRRQQLNNWRKKRLLNGARY